MGGTRKVMPKVAFEDLHGALVGEKGGTREIKTTNMRKKIILA